MKKLLIVASVLGLMSLQAASYAADQSSIAFSGVIEVEAGQSTDYSDTTASDIVLATFELGIEAVINDELSAAVVLLHEEDDTPLEVDSALITYQPTGAGWSVTGGQIFLPFGSFETNMVSDPLTLELGEIRESAVQLDVISGAVTSSFYLFNGDDKTNKTTNNKLDNFGLKVTYQHEGDVNVTASLSYLNDLANTDGMQGVISAGVSDEYVSATTIDVVVEAGDMSFIVEHMAAGDSFETGEFDFNGAGAKPSATNLELGYSFELSGKPAQLSVAQQNTKEAVALGLPESRTLIALSFEIKPSTSLSFEVSNDKDYSVADGGTGETASTFTTQLAVEF